MRAADLLRGGSGGTARPPRWSIATVLALCFSLVGCGAPLPSLHEVGSMGSGWHETGSMASPRDLAMATLLDDGKVLVAGGSDGSQSLTSAEIYDPKFGSFTATGSLNENHDGGTMTRLADGRVLVAGGARDKSISPTNSAEIYDPKTGTFSRTGSLNTARAGQAAVLLSDGRVLLVGGYGTDSESLASAELYDPKTGQCETTGSMARGRNPISAAKLPDGRVLVVGGLDSPSSAEIYDPTSGAFGATGSMVSGRWGGETIVALHDGRILVVGGYGPASAILSSAEFYDPVIGAFETTGSMSTPRVGPMSAVLPDGRVFVFGGATPSGKNTIAGLATSEMYEPSTGAFSPGPSMTAARQYYAAVQLLDGRVLAAGGDILESTGVIQLDSVEVYWP
jgi:hypothetical protein